MGRGGLLVGVVACVGFDRVAIGGPQPPGGGGPQLLAVVRVLRRLRPDTGCMLKCVRKICLILNSEF